MSGVVCWFSCGAASAVATHLALQEHPDAVIAYQDTGAEHPDSARFMADCEKWYGRKILTLKSHRFNDVWEVWEKRRYIVGVSGAPCTGEMKRRVAEDYLFKVLGYGTREVIGYTAEESKRVRDFEANNPERKLWPILAERGLSKADCFKVLADAGIELPEMYKLGYRNNNCIGCPKGQSGYWNKIRVDFPDVFDRMAKLERSVGAAINKTEPTVNGVRQRIPVYLDELDPRAGRYKAEASISCGLFCPTENQP